MKNLFRILLFALLPLAVQGAHVRFNLGYFTSEAAAYQPIKITPSPTNLPAVNGSQIITGNPKQYPLNSSGQVTVSNMAAITYICEWPALNPTITFQITVPNTNALIHAEDITSTASNIASVYTISAIDSLLGGYIAKNGSPTNGQGLTYDAATGLYWPSNAIASASLRTTKTLWVDAEFGSDLTGVRGRFDKPYATIGQAKTNAQAGDLIRVFPGTYTERDILKPGVNYHFYSGAQMTNYYSGSGSTRGVFDDYGGATTNTIDGNGQFDYFSAAFGDHGMMITTNPATEIHFRAKKVTCANDDSASGLVAAFLTTNCSAIYIDVDEYLDTKIADPDVESSAYCIYWRAGQMFVNIRNAKTEFGYIAWADNSANVTNDIYYSGHFAESTLGPTFYMSAATRNLKMWLDVLEIRADSSIAISTVQGQSGKVYVRSEKISGSPCVVADGTAELWVDAQKLTSVQSGTSWVRANAGCHLTLNVLQCEQGPQPMASGFALNGGTNSINVGIAVMTNAPSIIWQGGEQIVRGLFQEFNPGGIATNAPVWAMGTNGSLRLKAVTLLGGGTNAIYATNAQTVSADGLLTSTNAINPFVTLLGLRHADGILYGDGSGLTNINTSGVSNSLTSSFTNYVRTNVSYPIYQIGTTTFERWHQLGMPGLSVATAVGTVLTNNNWRMFPFLSGRGGIMDQIGICVNTTVVAGKFRLAIYAQSNSTNMFPSALVADFGEQGTDNAGIHATNVTATLQPGMVYWMAVAANTNTAFNAYSSTTPLLNQMGSPASFTNAPQYTLEFVGIPYGTPLAILPYTNTVFNSGSTTLPVVGARFAKTP